MSTVCSCFHTYGLNYAWCVNRFQCFSGHAQCSQNGGGTRELDYLHTGTASVLSLNPYTLRLFTLLVLYSLLVVNKDGMHNSNASC